MKVSVILAAYNAEKYIRDAIESILEQTYTDYEFIIVNDGSTDSTPDIIGEYKDPRIRLINQSNMGCALAREKAISQAKGKYIAIMDADDISLPERLMESVRFLDKHPSYVIVSTGFLKWDVASDKRWEVFHPSNDRDIRRALLRNTTFFDASSLIRVDAFLRAGGYKIEHMFDYELYSRLAKIGKMANIPKVLSIRRVHSRQFYRYNYENELVRKRRLKIRWLTLWRLKPAFPVFLKTFAWLSFEYFIHLIPTSIRHRLPEKSRSFFKEIMPLKK